MMIPPCDIHSADMTEELIKKKQTVWRHKLKPRKVGCLARLETAETSITGV